MRWQRREVTRGASLILEGVVAAAAATRAMVVVCGGWCEMGENREGVDVGMMITSLLP